MNVETLQGCASAVFPNTLPDYIRFGAVYPCYGWKWNLPPFEEVVRLYKKYVIDHLWANRKHFYKSSVNFNAMKIPVNKIDIFEKEFLGPFNNSLHFGLWLKFNNASGLLNIIYVDQVSFRGDDHFSNFKYKKQSRFIFRF